MFVGWSPITRAVAGVHTHPEAEARLCVRGRPDEDRLAAIPYLVLVKTLHPQPRISHPSASAVVHFPGKLKQNPIIKDNNKHVFI